MILLLPFLAIVGAAKYDAYIDREVHPPAWEWSEQLHSGQVVVEPSNGTGYTDIGGALIHDWTGQASFPA